MLRGPRSPVGCDGADGSYGTTAYLSRPGRRLFELWEKSTRRPTVAPLRSKPTRDGCARRIGDTGVIVRGPGARRIQG